MKLEPGPPPAADDFPPQLDRLRRLIGHEAPLHTVTQALHFAGTGLSPAAVGALHVTCADETERECAEAFQQGFVQFLLPSLKFARPAPMRLANLGGQYEWQAARVTENHYATPATAEGFKFIVLKLNSHVGLEEIHDAGAPGFKLGSLQRYDQPSACCAALTQTLLGSTADFAKDFQEVMESEGLDRIALLRDPARVDPQYRPLAAALVASRLQARKAVVDIQDYRGLTPTFWLVVPCVTVNRHQQDTEIVTGAYVIDERQGPADPIYLGLGDDPAAYEFTAAHGKFVVADPRSGSPRRGRNHRQLVHARWQERGPVAPLADPRLERIREDVARDRHHDHHHAKALLRACVPVLAEIAPVPAAILLFAHGAAGIHHAFRVHRLTQELEDSEDARQILDDIHQEVDQLDPDRARALIELLAREYGR